jgi:hypothetical protein
MTSALLAFLIAIKPFFLGEAELVGRATLVVETSSVREVGAGPAIARQVRLSGAALLRAADVAEGGGPSDLVVAVTVRTLRGPAIGYESTVALRQAGRRVTVAHKRCSLCTEGEVVADIQRSLARLAPRVRALTHG